MERRTAPGQSLIEKDTAVRKAVVKSAAQGGTMLMVQVLANTGLSPAEISQRLRKSYHAVASSEVHLRRLGLIEPSLRAKKRSLEQQIAHLPRDSRLRQQIMYNVSFYFYRENPDYFATFRDCFREADKKWPSDVDHYEVESLLRISRVATKTFETERGPYGIVYLVELERAARGIRRSGLFEPRR